MHSEPDWLEIDEYLYPSTILNKNIHISSSVLAETMNITASLIYNSYNRSIDITDVFANIVSQCN